jgi:hypothetical protein
VSSVSASSTTAAVTTKPAVIPANRLAAITLASVAAGVHAVLIAQQGQVWWGYGALIAAIAIAGAAIAIALALRPTTTVFYVAIAGTVTSTLLYVLSRTVGFPFGPGPSPALRFTDPLHGPGHPVYAQLNGRAESVGLLDLGCLVAEIALVVLLVSMLPEGRRRSVTNVLCAVGAALWVFRWTGVLA